MQLDQAPDEGQADSEAAPGAVKGLVGLHVHVEDEGQQRRRDAEPRVFDAQHRVCAAGAQGHANPATGWRVLDGVAEDVGDHLLDPDGVPVDPRRFGGDVDVPIQPWRHDTAFFGLPDGHTNDVPICIDEINGVYFRPEGRELFLVGLEAANEVGGSPDRPFRSTPPEILEDMVDRLCIRVPWMRDGTFRVAHGGQDGISTADQRPILGRAGPDGFVLACGFSGTGFKTAPAIGQCLTELILDGAATTVDISGYALERFAEGRPLRGPHPYGDLWR